MLDIRNRDLSSRTGAHYLAQRLKAYWLTKGVEIETRFEVLSEHADKPIYCVRSNLRPEAK